MSRAPGKLFIAGEYAVVEPGGRAVLVAVDRYLTARVSPSEHGTVTSAHFGSEPLRWVRDESGLVIAQDRGRPLDYALCAIRAVDALVADLGINQEFHALQITSELEDADGRKYGLGSSAAVTVAVVRALDEFYGLGLSAIEQFKVALLATLDIAPSASGGDVAASTFGGWIAYRSPDRVAVATMRERAGILAAVRQPWPLLEITPLPAPSTLELIVGWTGQAASTTTLVEDVRARREAPDLTYQQFLTASDARVHELVAGLNHDEPASVLGAVRAARGLLAGLGATLGIQIETPALAQLARSAEQIGAAGKSSGAGGGDCGIVLAPRSADIAPMLRSWEQAGVHHLPLGTVPATSTPNHPTAASTETHPAAQ